MTVHSFHFGTAFTAGVLQENVLERRPFPMQSLKQVHGVEIVEVTELGAEQEGDALITQVPGIPLLIKTADCIPVVFADEKTGWVAGAHAGWRGLTADIIPITLARLAEKGAQLHDLKVGIGPSLGVECALFSAPYEEIPAKYHWAIQKDLHVDLWGILKQQLLDAGILEAQVEWMRLCTACSPDWFSWRRNADPRRFGTFVMKNPND